MYDMVPLGTLATIKGGSGFPEIYQGNADGEYPFIKVSDMNLPENKREIYVANNYVGSGLVRALRLQVFPKNTVVFAKVGAAVYLNKRRVLTKETIIDNNMMGIVPLEIDSGFLYQFMLEVDFSELVQPGALPSINQEIVSLIPVPSISKEKQQKIAHILTTVDNLIENTQAIIDKYTAVKQGMMHDLFTRGIDLATGQLRPSYEQAPELYKETELGWVPREWGLVRLDELGEIVTGNTPSTNNLDLYGDEYMFVSPADIGGDSVFIFTTEKNLSDLGMRTSRVIPAGSVCTVCIGSTIGKMAVTTSICTTNQQINTLIPNTKQFGSLYYYLMRHYLLPQLKVEAGLQAVPIVNKSRFSGLKISIPNSDDECKGIYENLTGVDRKITAEVDVLGKLHLQKKGLMQDLLTGRMRVA